MTFAPFKITTPATTANLGPGFDCLGLALGLRNELEVHPSDSTRIRVEGEGEHELPEDEENLVLKTFLQFYSQLGKDAPRVEMVCRNRIPLARGLGSSAAVRVSALVAANHAAGKPLKNDEVLQIAVRDEGHPDNVAPALLGGMVVCGRRGEKAVFQPFRPKSGIRAVLLIPEFHLETRRAREVLPKTVRFEDAVVNLQNTSLTVTAFITGNYEILRFCMEDRLHQPYREPLIPGFQETLRAAREAGALGAALSGAGPTMIAFANKNEVAIAESMKRAFRKASGKACTTKVAGIETSGAQIISLEDHP